MARYAAIISFSLVLAGCGSRTSSSNTDGLQSDLPLQSVSYYVTNPAELAKMDGICTAWKGSQRPPASWPAVVVSNCNNVDAAKGEVVRNKEREKLLKEAGS